MKKDIISPVSMDEALSILSSENRVFIQSGAEYSVTNLFGINLAQRPKSLIEMAHLDHRESLENEAFNLMDIVFRPTNHGK